jgi:hypothetical protein
MAIHDISFPPHVHVMSSRAWGRIGKPYCTKCGRGLEFVLKERTVEIVRQPMPTFWTSWRELRSDEVPRG